MIAFAINPDILLFSARNGMKPPFEDSMWDDIEGVWVVVFEGYDAQVEFLRAEGWDIAVGMPFRVSLFCHYGMNHPIDTAPLTPGDIELARECVEDWEEMEDEG